MKLNFFSIVLSIAALIAATADLVINIIRSPDLARRIVRRIRNLRSQPAPRPGDPDYPWPTVEALALIAESEHETCVCGKPIVLWDYPRQGRADGSTRWWVHVETARRSRHPVEGPQRYQGFAMPAKRVHRGLD